MIDLKHHSRGSLNELYISADKEYEVSVAPVPDIRKEDKKPTTRVSVEFEDDVLQWFRGMGRGWQKKLNDVLRWYISEVEKQTDEKDKRL